MISELIRRYRFWSSCDRVGPDIPLTHWRLHFPTLMRSLCERKFGAFGPGSEFRPGAYAIATSKIFIGSRVTIRPQTMLFAFPPGPSGSITIEDDVLIGSGVHIYTANHRFSDPSVPIAEQGHSEPSNVIIQKGAWIGAGAIILPGVNIGSGAVIGAGSIVTAAVPNNCVAAGNPARVLRSRATN